MRGSAWKMPLLELMLNAEGEMQIAKNERELKSIVFEDSHGTRCSIQESSLMTEPAVWVGVDDPAPKRLGDDMQWRDIELPPGTSLRTRMHLTGRQITYLIDVLERFLESGELA